jgi:flagella basal body P-ring formation protein FlgA
MKLFANYVRRLVMVLLSSYACAAEPVVVQVHEQSSVANSYATLEDVATLSGDTTVISVIKALTVAELPDMMPRRIDEQIIRMTLGRELSQRLQFRGVGTVQRAAIIIPAEKLTEAAQGAFSAANDEIVCTVLRHSGAVSIAAGGDYRLLADALDKQPSGDIPVRVRVLRGEVELARSLITLRVQRFRLLAVTTRALPRGTRIGADDIRLERTLMTTQHSDAIAEPQSINGFEVRSALAQGTVLLRHQVVQAPDIVAGATVELVVMSGQFQLSTAAVALTSGSIGDTIQVRRQNDGRAVRGRVQDNRSVLFER